jgi:hypothetical protein
VDLLRRQIDARSTSAQSKSTSRASMRTGFTTWCEAIAAAIEGAGPGDTVVLCGKGHEASIIVGEEERPWDEAGAARDALRARGYAA